MNVLLAIMTFMALVPSVGFVVLYARSPWRSNAIGQSVMLMAVSLVILCLMGVLGLALGPDYWGRSAVRIIGTTLVIVALWRQFFVMRGVQSRNPKYLRGLRAVVNKDKEASL